ncbi:receptor-type tyrosine-protein phosphatase N2 isoform X1 [Lepisosteus oculatus]|uniref:receptor-type tyrosine-protein phosphatase N2 isoform X1 n=1 Tax=Lepisosteus oculatus TaxID=7918 RepID=UPI0037184DED
MDSIYTVLLVLLVFHSPFIVAAERKFGCLFEDELCTTYEICVNDGVFGRCQRVPVIDVYRYEVSPAALQRLRSLLQKLSQRGLTWKDDATQQVISKELSKLRKVYYRLSETNSPDIGSNPRTPSQNIDSEKKYGQNGDLSRSVQQYLLYLGYLPQSGASASQKTKNEQAPIKNDAILTDRFMDYIRQKTQGQGKPSPPKFSAASLFQPGYPDPLPPAKSFSPYAHQGPPAPHGTGPFQGPQPDKSKVLVAALEGYLAKKLSAKQPEAGRLEGKPGSLVYSGKLRPFLTGRVESIGPQEEAYKGKVPFRLAPEGELQKPQTDRLLFKAVSNPPVAKDPLSLVDENFIQNVVKELGKHNVNVDGLSPKELDELADVIADTLQVVDEDKGRDKEDSRDQRDMKRGPAPRLLQYQEDILGEDAMMQERQLDEAKPDSNDKDSNAVNKLLEYLDKNSMTESPPRLDVQTEDGKLKARGRSEAFEESSTDEKGVGVENVKSKTILKDLAAQKKEARPAEVDSKELSELHDWVRNAKAPSAAVHVEPEKKGVQFEEEEEELQLDVKSRTKPKKEEEYGYVVTDSEALTTDQGLHLMEVLARQVKLQMADFDDVDVLGPAVTFKVRSNPQNISTADVANIAVKQKISLEKEAGVKILQAGHGDKSQLKLLPLKSDKENSTKFLILTLISIVCIIGVLVASGVIYCLRHRSHHKLKEKLTGLGSDTGSDATATYQELCRQRMAVKTSERPEPQHSSRINSVSSQFSDGPIPSPTARSSTSSWCEEPVQSNMDISTGHMILSYMEDHLKNKNRLEKEWEALCAYQAEPNATSIAQREENSKKNRCSAVVVYDHSRITLKVENNHGNSDYINASPIMDHDPRNPAYIATQGPLPATVADFWQMVWENGCVVIVMLTPLTENGVKQCYHYWPDEGSNLYHIYEVNLVSEHIWCEDFLVRSFYLKNMQTNETRTVTQFHFLTWMNKSVPESTRSLLDFRRKVNKCYRGRSCPIIVHCSDGSGRSGTYILIDMVLNKMAKGAKEIDIAATLEHLRDQRPGMVQTKEQFEFALTAVAEEVNAILKALPQ